jgi:lipoprotein NlpI
MTRLAGAFLACAALLLPADSAVASALEDANAAVMAARNGQYVEAIRLFTLVVNSDELNLAGRAQAYSYRGIAKATVADYDGAQDDLNRAVALDSPYNADAYAYRGYFEMVQGDAQKGAADLAKSASLKLWGYNVVWLSLARMRANVPDTDDNSLAKNAAKLDLAQWPGAVVKYLMGQGTPADLSAAAKQGDPAKLVERVCDADFYTAEYYLAHNGGAAAKPLLQSSAEKCPFASFERMGATAELARLK